MSNKTTSSNTQTEKQPVISSSDDLAVEPLEGSGFENQTPESDFEWRD